MLADMAGLSYSLHRFPVTFVHSQPVARFATTEAADHASCKFSSCGLADTVNCNHLHVIDIYSTRRFFKFLCAFQLKPKSQMLTRTSVSCNESRQGSLISNSVVNQ